MVRMGARGWRARGQYSVRVLFHGDGKVFGNAAQRILSIRSDLCFDERYVILPLAVDDGDKSKRPGCDVKKKCVRKEQKNSNRKEKETYDPCEYLRRRTPR